MESLSPGSQCILIEEFDHSKKAFLGTVKRFFLKAPPTLHLLLEGYPKKPGWLVDDVLETPSGTEVSISFRDLKSITHHVFPVSIGAHLVENLSEYLEDEILLTTSQMAFEMRFNSEISEISKNSETQIKKCPDPKCKKDELYHLTYFLH